MSTTRKTVQLTNASLMTSLAILLSYFPEIPLAFFAPWLKLDFSFTPLLLLGFSTGPVLMMVGLLVTNAVHILGGTSGMVGELANMIVGLAFLLPPVLIYQGKKTRGQALTGMLLGTLLMVVAGILANRYILLPTYFGSNYESVLQSMGIPLEGYLFGALIPFNLIKGLLNSLITFWLYKRLSVILKKADEELADTQ